MRFAILGIAFILFAAAGGAEAGIGFCDRPSKPFGHPYIGTTGGGWPHAEMALREYLRNMADYIDCMQREMTDAASEAKAIRDDWNRAVDEQSLYRRPLPLR